MALFNSTQFEVKEIKIITKRGTEVDVSKVYEELNIYDSMFSTAMSGNISILDSVAMSATLKFDGAESILIHIIKDESISILNFKKSFRIYKQKNRQNRGLNSEMHVLYFVSDEFIYSEQKKVNQYYEGTYSEIAQKILGEYVKPPSSKLQTFEPSLGLKKIVVPNLRPLEAIEWCAKRSTDFNKSPNFVFYEDVFGFRFATLSKLLSFPPQFAIKIELKNEDDNPFTELLSARSYELLSFADAFDRTRQGVYAGKYMGFDPITRTIITKKISYRDHWDSMKHGNPNPNLGTFDNRDGVFNVDEYDSRKSIYMYETSQKESSYIKSHDPTSLSKLENYEDFIFQRRAIFKNLLSKHVKLTVPGNFLMTSGVCVEIYIPEFDFKLKSDDNLDDTVRGKYIIIGTRHIIGMEKHETIIEIASSSSIEASGTSHPRQTGDLLAYPSAFQQIGQ
jgi:hypothetical protein